MDVFFFLNDDLLRKSSNLLKELKPKKKISPAALL